MNQKETLNELLQQAATGTNNRHLRKNLATLLRIADKTEDVACRNEIHKLALVKLLNLALTSDADDTPRKPLADRMLKISALATLPPVVPLVDGLVYVETVGQLSGNPGCYKSFATIGIACALASGQESWEGHSIPKRRRVVYVAAEGANGLRARILGWCELTRVDPTTLENWLYVYPEPVQLGDPDDVDELTTYCIRHGIGLVILDTRSRCTVGLDENSATEQGRAIDAAEHIQRKARCACMVVHHSSRNGTAGRGSNAWDGAVWSDLRMSGDNHTATIHCQKHKDTDDGCDHHYRLVPHTVSAKLMPGCAEAQRSTLVMVAALSAKAENSAEKQLSGKPRLAEICAENCGPEGLSMCEIKGLWEAAGFKKTSAYANVKRLVEDGLLVTSGNGVRTRYHLASSAL